MKISSLTSDVERRKHIKRCMEFFSPAQWSNRERDPFSSKRLKELGVFRESLCRDLGFLDRIHLYQQNLDEEQKKALNCSNIGVVNGKKVSDEDSKFFFYCSTAKTFILIIFFQFNLCSLLSSSTTRLLK